MKVVFISLAVFIAVTGAFAAVDSKVCDTESPAIGSFAGSGLDAIVTINEGFEGGTMPPSGWFHYQYNPVRTWVINNSSPYEGTYYAECLYDETYTDDQHEWIYSPAIACSGTISVDFAWQGSYYWGVDPYDNYDLLVAWSTVNDAEPDGDIVWDFDDAQGGSWTTWQWYTESVDIDVTPGATVYVGFGYDGYDGAQGDFDAITIEYDDEIPPGIESASFGSIKAIYK